MILLNMLISYEAIYDLRRFNIFTRGHFHCDIFTQGENLFYCGICYYPFVHI